MKNLLTAALLIVAIFCFSNQALAKIYTWVDQDGVTHLSDVPPTSDQNTETLETTDSPAPGPDSTKHQIVTKPILIKVPQENTDIKSKDRENHTDDVEIYTTSWCPYCKQAIAFLRSNRINFRQYDVERDRKAAARMRELGGTGGVPFAIINGKKIGGFSLQAYKQALGLL
jgi:glutaredoxin